jgi:transposase-like protein
MYDVSSSSIHRFLRVNGIEIRAHVKSTKISREQLDEMAKRHQDGERIFSLANEFGVSDSTIYEHFKKANIVFQFPKKILNKEEIVDLYHNQRLHTTKICLRVGIAKPGCLYNLVNYGITSYRIN